MIPELLVAPTEIIQGFIPIRVLNSDFVGVDTDNKTYPGAISEFIEIFVSLSEKSYTPYVLSKRSTSHIP